MKRVYEAVKSGMVFVMIMGCSLFFAAIACAHCDTTGGPVIPEAQAALQAGDVTPLLKWVQAADEAEIKDAFAKAVVVRAQSPEAQTLADHYFIETLVRVHRAGEGAPYTGIKDAPVEPIIALVDETLVDGSAEKLVTKMSGHLSEAINEKFSEAFEAQKNKDTSVEAGREYVKAYVTYMHYVEGVRAAIMSAGGHHQEADTEPAATEHAGHQV